MSKPLLLICFLNFTLITFSQQPVPHVAEGNNLVSKVSFDKITTRDFAKINGLDKENNFQTGINIDLLDDFKLKGDFNIGTLKKDNKRIWYTNNIGFELGLDEDLKKLVKRDEKSFTLTVNYSGTLLFLNRGMWSNTGRDIINQKIDSCNNLLFKTGDRNVTLYSIDGKKSYFLIGKDNFLLSRDTSAWPCVYFAEQNTSLYNTKKFHWFAYKFNAGFSGITVYNAGNINRQYAPNISLDLSYNFYQWVNPSYKRGADRLKYEPNGAKYITLGMEISYEPLDESKKNEYAKVADSLAAVNAIGKYNTAETKEAYNGTTYSEMVKLKPHFDMYWFITKNRIVAVHAGIDGVFYKQIKYIDDWTIDLNFRIGLAFQIPSCFKNCTDDQRTSKVSFEILFVGKEVFGASSFKEAIGPALKVGVPIANLK